MIYFLLFSIGASIGSFLTLLSIRRNRNENFIKGRSYCDHCKKRLRAVDNIPIISYVLLSGRSSCCNNRINPIYPIFEFISGIGFVIGFIKFGISMKFLLFLLIFMVLVLITITDIMFMDIYDIDSILLVILLILFRFVDQSFSIETIKSILFVVIVFYLIYKISVAMGSGDVLLSLSLGAASRGIIDSIYNITYTFTIGAAVSIMLLAFKIKNKKDYIPFGPFITITILGVLIWKY